MVCNNRKTIGWLALQQSLLSFFHLPGDAKVLVCIGGCKAAENSDNSGDIIFINGLIIECTLNCIPWGLIVKAELFSINQYYYETLNTCIK
jgi:hypothetical protein